MPRLIEQAHHDPGFRGNANLRAPNTVDYVDLETKQQREDEIIKCGLYPLYFCEKYFTILDLDEGKVTLELYDKQRELVEAIFDNRRVINLASRQVGKTTAYTVFCMHTCIFENDKKILICADSEEKAKEFLDRIKLAYENLPNWLKPSVLVWNKKKIKFGNGCTIMAVATSSNASRGYSANYCISGNSTIKIKIDGRTYKNKKTTDAYQMLEDKKTNCPCLELNDIDPAIEFCKMAVDIK